VRTSNLIHNKEVHNLYPSPNTARWLHQERRDGLPHAACTEELTIYKIFKGKLMEKYYFGVLRIVLRKLLAWIIG
jgi:hypothetical protein